MSISSKVRFFLFLLVAACASAALVVIDVGALPQNTNSSTTVQEENTNAHRGHRGRRGRRGRRGSTRRAAAAEANANANTGDMTGTETVSDNANTGMAAAPQDTGGGTNEDLSGTYTGTVRMTGGHEMSGEGTLTITGNTFTLTVDTMNHSGRVYAINTRKYVGAAFYFTDITDPVSNTPLAASVRVRRRGNVFTLEPVPGARNRLSFRGRSS